MARKPAIESDVNIDGGVADAASLGAPMADPAQTGGSLSEPLAGTQGAAALAGGADAPPADPLEEVVATLNVRAVVKDRLDHDGLTYQPGDVVTLPIAAADRLYRMGVVTPTA